MASNTSVEKCALCDYFNFMCSSSCFFKPYFPTGRLQDVINVHEAFNITNVLEWLTKLTPGERDAELRVIIEQACKAPSVVGVLVELGLEERHKLAVFLSKLNGLEEENRVIYVDEENPVPTDSLFQKLDARELGALNENLNENVNNNAKRLLAQQTGPNLEVFSLEHLEQIQAALDSDLTDNPIDSATLDAYASNLLQIARHEQPARLKVRKHLHNSDLVATTLTLPPQNTLVFPEANLNVNSTIHITAAEMNGGQARFDFTITRSPNPSPNQRIPASAQLYSITDGWSAYVAAHPEMRKGDLFRIWKSDSGEHNEFFVDSIESIKPREV